MATPIEYATDIDRAALVEIGQGAEGRVFEFANDPSTVYKEFHLSSQNPPNTLALNHLINLRSAWTEEERSWIEERTVWPRTAVLDGGRLRGYLMKRIPEAYFRQHGVRVRPRKVICDWNFLSMRGRYATNANLVSTVPHPTTEQVSKLIVDLARTIEILHRHEVIVGDISGRNLIWTDRPSWQVILIDCDGFRIRGSGAVNYGKQTPDWEDPALGQNHTNQQSDIYKLGIAAFRAVWAATTDRPPAHLGDAPTPEGAPLRLNSLIHRSTSSASRPSAAEWVEELALGTSAVPTTCPQGLSPSGTTPQSSDSWQSQTDRGTEKTMEMASFPVKRSRPVIPMQKTE